MLKFWPCFLSLKHAWFMPNLASPYTCAAVGDMSMFSSAYIESATMCISVGRKLESMLSMYGRGQDTRTGCSSVQPDSTTRTAGFV